jgi:esterase/lipase superfamily enzyme
MQTSYHNEYSHKLGRNMEYKVYGHKGKPVLVFPTSKGRFYQYEDFGMIHALSRFINDGTIQLWAADGIDWETFFSDNWNSWDKIARIKRHEQYFSYINEELIPAILQTSQYNNGGQEQQLLLTGCSMGAYHSANFYFRYPWSVDTVIALSGVYSTNYFFGDYKPTEIYLNSPIDYLKGNQDGYYMDKFRKSKLIFCCGHGAYEAPMLNETYALKSVLEAKDIPAWFDFWGTDSKHDWDWWQKQIVYFMEKALA